jgi:two-component system OmpR family response regulator
MPLSETRLSVAGPTETQHKLRRTLKEPDQHWRPMRVLIVEDKVKMAGQLWRALRGEGMAVDVAINGEDALWMAAATNYDAVVLDVMLPGIDGFETVRRLRDGGQWSPVLMLTARGSLDDRVAGLDGGADDYMTKPFELKELVARLRALVRRDAVERPTVLQVGTLRLDPASRRVWRDEHEIDLAEKPFALLEAFMRRPGVTLTRTALLDSAWDHAYSSRSNVVDQHVRALRDRIDRPFGVKTLETVRGRGYRLREDERR